MHCMHTTAVENGANEGVEKEVEKDKYGVHASMYSEVLYHVILL